MVWLAEEKELPLRLGGENGRGAAAEASVVQAGDGWVMVGELRPNLGSSDGKQRCLGFLGGGTVGVPAVLGVVVGIGIHRRISNRGRWKRD